MAITYYFNSDTLKKHIHHDCILKLVSLVGMVCHLSMKTQELKAICVTIK